MKIAANEVVSFVGGGGKTTAILRLCREFTLARHRIIVTTTTRMGRWETPLHTLVTTGRRSVSLSEDLVCRIRTALNDTQIVTVAGEVEPTKLIGIPSELVSELSTLADEVLVEADGARSRPLKAPAAYEPVWPQATTLAVAVVGIDAVGAQLDSSSVHRPENVAAITGLAISAPVTPQAIVSCVLHENGLLARVPEKARRAVLVNKVKTRGEREDAELVKALLNSHDESLHVVLADVQPEFVRIWP